MPEFKAGDVVQLKSDGPVMTIEKIDREYDSPEGELSAWCSWFVGKELKTHTFKLQALVFPDTGPC